MKKPKSNNIRTVKRMDGAVSLFVASKDVKKEQKKKEMFHLLCQKLVPNAHTLEQLVEYMETVYQARKVPTDCSSYVTEYRNIKSALVLQKRPDYIATPMPEKPNREQMADAEFMLNYFRCIEQRNEEACEVSDDLFPIDLEQYLIEIKDTSYEGRLLVNIEYEFELLGISTNYAHNSKPEKESLCDSIVKDIYKYYGVREEDIEEENERCRTYIHMVGL